MDSPRDTDVAVLDSDSAGEGDGRDLRDVLRRLVVVEGDRADVSLAAVAEAAGASDRLVPDLLAALEDDATTVRVGAAWVLCALADDQPAAVEYLATNLVDRVDDGPFEVGQVFSYLRGRYPGRVADVVDVAVEVDGLDEPTRTDDERAAVASDQRAPATPGRRRTTPRPPDGQDGKRVETDGGVPAGTVADLGNGRQVVRSNADGEARPVGPTGPPGPGEAREPRRRTPPADPPRDHPTHPDYESEAAADVSPDRSADGTTDERRARSPPQTRARTEAPARAGSRASPKSTPDDPSHREPSVEQDASPDTFAAIGSLSSLDSLSAVDTGVEERYATGYRCRAVDDGDERGAAVRLFDRPDDDDRLSFRTELEDCLARWQTLADADGVVDVAEWGARPRPWLRTEPVDASLAERGAPDAASAVDQAVELAAALVEVHARGAVHGGIDPKNVVYPCDMGALDRPMLDNVGLMGVFRQFFEPANYLDPRFAAPEYFDDDFGTVDAATDVYGLGAVVYYLVTGRPPFDGSYSEVRRGILRERPSAPSDVSDGAPPRVDAVVAKALAKEKIKRYDGVDAFRRDLQQIRDGA